MYAVFPFSGCDSASDSRASVQAAPAHLRQRERQLDVADAVQEVQVGAVSVRGQPSDHLDLDALIFDQNSVPTYTPSGLKWPPAFR